MKRVLIVVCALLIQVASYAQGDVKTEYIEITALNVKTHLELTILLEKQGLKVLYSCIPAGILVIRGEQNFDSDALINKVKKLLPKHKVARLEEFTLADAEAACSSSRNNY